MKTILRVIDSVSEWTGKIARWFCVALVLVVTYGVIMRYVFNSPTMWTFQTAFMLGAVIYVLSFSYIHRHNAHVRIDVLYTRLSPRQRAVIDVVGSLLLFFPLIIILAGSSSSWAWHAWVINEKMVETYWYPPAAPVRTLVAIGFFLFALQGGARFIRDSYLLIKNKPYD